jgi:hypothetical protein
MPLIFAGIVILTAMIAPITSHSSATFGSISTMRVD